MGDRAGPGVAVRSWARHDLRSRWRALLALALIAGIAGGFALALLAGSRRTNTAFDRLRASTHASDAVVFPSQVGQFHPKWATFSSRPEIAELTRWYLAFGQIDGEGELGVLFGSVDGAWLRDMDRPVVLHGRMFDPRADDEVVIHESIARDEHIKIGDTFGFHAFGAGQDDVSGDPPKGEKLQFRVVGIVRTVQPFLFTPMVMVPPGVVEKHGNNMEWVENAYVRLRPDLPDAFARLQRDANTDLAQGTPVLDLRVAQRRVDTTTDVEETALWLIAIAVAAAGFVLVAQVVARSAATIADDAPTLRAVGLRRREITAAAVLPHAAVAAAAGVVAIITAIVASRWFPVGLAADVDPDRGLHADWLVLAPGAVLIALFVVASAALVGARASRALRVRRGARRSSLARWVRTSAPASVGIGTSMVLQPRTRRADVSARPAIVAAIVGVLGVVATLTINQGLQDALAHPERAGVTWQASAVPKTGDVLERGVTAASLAAARAVDGVRVVANVERAVIDVNGVGTQAFTVRDEGVGFTVLSGHAPHGPDEVAVGPSTATALHLGTGDVIKVGVEGSASSVRELRVTGRALFPTEVHATFDEGVWLPREAWDAVVPPNERGAGSGGNGAEELIAIRFEPGVSTEAGLARLRAQAGDRFDDVGPVDVPTELTNLRNVRSLPAVLASFLALLALAALSYVLLATTRARSRDFAVLRAIGFTRGQNRAVVGSQSAVVAVIGLLAGIPLGIVAGRAAWSLITERVPIEDVPPTAVVALAVFIPLALLAAGLTVVWPARRVNRIRPAEALRTE